MYLEDRGKLAKPYDFGIIESAGEPLIADPPDEPNDENKEELMKL